jgi:hypothetical protein
VIPEDLEWWLERAGIEAGPSPGVFLRKDVIPGELDRDFAQGCEFKGVSGDSWCRSVGSAVVRIDK